MFYRLQPEFRKLPQNAQITAKEEFENLLSSQQERMFLRTYMTSGINANSDIMFWRMGHSIIKLQEFSSAAQKTGIGKWLDPVKSFIGTAGINANDGHDAEKEAEKKYGRLPYMRLNALNKFVPDKNTKGFFFKSEAFSKYDYVHLTESSSPDSLNKNSEEHVLKGAKEKNFSEHEVFFGIGRGLTEILDFLA